ncbi:PAN6 [Sanghuangporus sanghuang]
MSTSNSSIPIFQSLDELRAWRSRAFAEGKSVGFVPTMGALHEGHLALVRRSLEENDHTIVSIFVNPTQFAPHEDLATYPRTLPQDLAALASLSPASQRTTSGVFVPSVDVMYPPTPETSTFYYSASAHKSPNTPKEHAHHAEVGTFVEVAGLSATLEGRTRPHFFRGVATVVAKLFNAVQPSHAYFGQKDIQQALILRRMVRDLLLPHPTPETLHVVPTTREAADVGTARNDEDDGEGLALSSRNAYLSRAERAHAPALYRALKRAQTFWEDGRAKDACVKAAVDVLEMEEIAAAENGVHMKLDYIEMSDPWTLEPVPGAETKDAGEREDREFVLSGAVWVGGTRLIDNVILGDSGKILY